MPLSDDQKAMLRLLSQRGEQGYEDIAALKGLSVEAVGAQVRDALAELERDGIPAPEIPPPPGEPLPPPEKPKPAPPTAPSRPRRAGLPSSRQARAAIAAGLGAIAIVVAILLIGGSGSGGSTTTATSEGAGSGESAARSKLTGAVLKPVDGGDAKGAAVFGRGRKQILLQVEAVGLDPTPKGSTYTIWLYKSPQLALRVGAVTVGKSGGIRAQLPIPAQVLRTVAGGIFDQIDVSLTSSAAYDAEVARAKREKKLPGYVGTDVLRGPITGPLTEAAK